jgi:hypothetical protein
MTDAMGQINLTAQSTIALSTSSPKFGTASLDITTGAGKAVITSYTQTNPKAAAQLLNLGLDDFTVEFFIKTTQATVAPTIGVYDSVSQMRWCVNASVTGGFTEFSFDTGNFSIIGAIAINDGNWHHIAVQRWGVGNYDIYIDGVLDVTDFGFAYDLSTPNGGFFFIGNQIAPNDGVFKMDELRITRRRRYVANFTPPAAQFSVG